MTKNQTQMDKDLKAMAGRLRLTFIRNNMDVMLNNVIEAKSTPREVLKYFFEKELEQREHNRGKQMVQGAHFPAIKTMEEFDFEAQPSIDAGVIRDLSTMDWVRTGRNLALFGPTGVGKTHLAIALGFLAIAQGLSVRFYNAAQLVSILSKAHKDGVLESRLKEINKYHLLIIDEVGYIPFSPDAAYLLYHIVNRRYEKKSIIVTGNRPPAEWGEIFGDSSAAEAVLDRLLHHCTIMTIIGDSYRMREHQKANLAKKPVV